MLILLTQAKSLAFEEQKGSPLKIRLNVGPVAMVAIMIVMVPLALSLVALFFYGLWTHNILIISIAAVFSSFTVIRKVRELGWAGAMKDIRPIRTLGLYVSVWFHIWPLIVLFFLAYEPLVSGKPLIFGRNNVNQ